MTKFIRIFLLVGVSVCLLPKAVLAEDSQTKAEQSVEINTNLTDFEQITENETAILYVNKENLAIKIKDKRNNYIWSSTLDDLDNERLNKSWKKFISSGITIDYLNESGKSKRETAEDARIKVKAQANGFEAVVTFRSNIRMTLEVLLDGSTVHVSVPKAKINEPKRVKLVTMNLYPFLGSTKQDLVSGYMFIPDGSGGLINYEDTSLKMTSPYQGAVYGVDQALQSEVVSPNTKSPYTVTMPIFGIAHGINQNALLTTIHSAEEYATITAYKAGLLTDFNWITAVFNYRYPYQQPTGSNDSAGVLQYQQEINPLDIELTYTFLIEKEANYVGMAKNYQQQIFKEDEQQKNSQDSELVRLNFLGGASEKGLLWDKLIPMSTIEQVKKSVKELNAEGTDQLLVEYSGWGKGGLAKNSNTFPIEKQLGSTADFQGISQTLAKQKAAFALNADYGRITNKVNGISANHFAQQINGHVIKLVEDEQVFQALSPKGFVEQAKADKQEYSELGVNYLTLSGIGELLYSDYTNGKAMNRTAAKAAQIKAIEELKEQRRIGLTNPNNYLWEQMDTLLNIPMSGSTYTFVSEAVPFLQIVLKGHRDYYAPYSNFSANQKDDFLKLVDYGAFPSFMLTYESAERLSETNSKNLYSTDFNQWTDTITSYYKEIEAVNKETKGSTIMSREQLQKDCIKVSYANGTVIYVNYSNEKQEIDGIKVAEKSYHIEKGE